MSGGVRFGLPKLAWLLFGILPGLQGRKRSSLKMSLTSAGSKLAGGKIVQEQESILPMAK
jgi:hypothetical protein